MDDKKSLLTTLPPLLVAVGTLITAVIGLGNFMSSPAPSITAFDVSPSIIDAGGNATLKWAISGEVSNVSIDHEIGAVALSGSRLISPGNTTNYTLTAKNKGQVKTATTQLIVRSIKVVHGGIAKNNSSIQKPTPISAPSSTNKVRDEPVHNDVPLSLNAVNKENNSNANILNSTINSKTINTTKKVETIRKDKSAISSKSTGDEPIQLSNSGPVSRSKEITKSTDTSSISTGDEPIQIVGQKSANVKNASNALNVNSQTSLAKGTVGSKKAQSNVGDLA